MNHLERTEGTGKKVENAGRFIMRYGLVIILLWLGLLKFTPYEAKAIQGLVAQSPFMGWAYTIFSVQGLAAIIAVIEIILAILIAIHPVAPKMAAVGGWGAVIMALLTLSFLFSTPGIIQSGHSFPFLSVMPGQFLIKDILFLGIAVWTAGESMRMADK